MKTLLTFSLCLFAIVAHAANPSTKSFRATGGLVVTSNDVTGLITYDGSGISGGSATNAQPPSTTLSNLAANAYTGYTNAPAPSTSMGRSMSNLLVGRTLFVDSVYGTNTTAIRGDASKPWRDVHWAHSNAVAGDTVFIRPGYYDIGTNNIRGKPGVSIVGATLKGVTIECSGDMRTNGPVISGASTQLVENVKLVSVAAGNSYHAIWGAVEGINSSFTNARLVNVGGLSDTDGIYISSALPCSVDIINPDIETRWDCVVVSGNSNHVIRIFNPRLIADPSLNYGGAITNTASLGDAATCIRNGAGVLEVYGGICIATNGGTDGTIGVQSVQTVQNGTHTNITRLYGVRIVAAGTDETIRISAGNVAGQGFVYEYGGEPQFTRPVAGPYSAQFFDGTILVTNAVNRLIILPDIATGMWDGLTLTIHDLAQLASTTNIVVASTAQQYINKTMTSSNITFNGGFMELIVRGTNWYVMNLGSSASSGSNYLFDAAIFNAVAAAGNVNVGIKAGAIMPGFYADTGILYGGGVLDYGLYYDTGTDTLYYQDARFAPNYTNIFGISNGFANFFVSPVLNDMPASSLLRTTAGKRVGAVTVGANLTWDGTTLAGTGGGTGASTNQVLTNLIGTVTRNVTNVVSLSTSNATSKPLTNSYTDGVLTLRGLEAGANTTITANGSNFVIASTGGGGLAGHSNAIAYINPQGTALTYYDTGNSMTNPGFGFNPTTLGGPHGGYAGLMVFANDPLGLVTIGHPNPGADFSTYATALVVSNRYNSAGGYKNDMIKFDAVIVNGGNLQSDSTLTRWRVWQAPSGGGSSTSSNDVAEITIGGDLKLDGAITLGDPTVSLGSASFGTNFVFEGIAASTQTVYRLPKNATPGVMVAIPVAGNTNQMTNVTLTAGQVVSHNGTTYVATNAIIGVTNGGNAAAGYIGEYIVSNVVVRTIGATTVFTDMASVDLTPGDWDITAVGVFNINGATAASPNSVFGIFPLVGNNSTGGVLGDSYVQKALNTTDNEIVFPLTVPTYRYNTPTNKTLYLKFYATYSAGAPILDARLSARRMR